MSGDRRLASQEPGKVVLVRVALDEWPGARAYYLTTLAVAERWAAGAGDGDQVTILSRKSLAVAAAVPDAAVKPGGYHAVHLVGIQRPDGAWVQPATGRAAERN